MAKKKCEDEVQLSSRVPRSFRDRINGDAVVAGCSVGELIIRMHQSLDPTARRRVERSLGKLGTALNDAGLPEDVMRDVSAAMADLRAAIQAMIP